MSEPGCVGVVGAGLIGGSLLLALRHARPELPLVAIDVDPCTRIRVAQAVGATTSDAFDVLEQCDVVVLALPVQALLDLTPKLLTSLMNPATVITDTGGVKGPVMRVATGAPRPFVGGHPMAGLERGGFEHATAELFRDRVVAICEPEPSDESATRRIEAMWHLTGARTVRCEADEHDRAVAGISHLPHLMAGVTASIAASSGALAPILAAGGFRDTTRVATDQSIRWALAQNPYVPAAAREAARRLLELAEALERGEVPERALDEAAAARDAIIPRRV